MGREAHLNTDFVPGSSTTRCFADGTKELLSWKSQKKRHEHRMIQCMPETSHLRDQ